MAAAYDSDSAEVAEVMKMLHSSSLADDSDFVAPKSPQVKASCRAPVQPEKRGAAQKPRTYASPAKIRETYERLASARRAERERYHSNVPPPTKSASERQAAIKEMRAAAQLAGRKTTMYDVIAHTSPNARKVSAPSVKVSETTSSSKVEHLYR
jgi:hypothetical protein